MGGVSGNMCTSSIVGSNNIVVFRGSSSSSSSVEFSLLVQTSVTFVTCVALVSGNKS